MLFQNTKEALTGNKLKTKKLDTSSIHGDEWVQSNKGAESAQEETEKVPPAMPLAELLSSAFSIIYSKI